MDMALSVMVPTVPKALENLEKLGEKLSPSPVMVGSNAVKADKASPSLGLQQKTLKSRDFEKASKVGRKKDLEKIRMMGETLVESGSMNTLDSHFSNTRK